MRHTTQPNGSRDLNRLVISTGRRTEPRLYMAHPMGETKRRRWLPVLFIIAVVVIIGLAGMSR
jgi:hypothetical protein